MLFENKHRDDLTPKQRLEHDFDFLNRSSMPAAQKVRDFYNLWLSRFPEEEALELISRIKSKDEQNCKSATFEIVLYAILITKGYSVSIHPELDNGSKKRPDFLVQTQSGEEFYLEAILASDKDSYEIAAQKRKDQVLKIIDKIDCPNFFLDLQIKGIPKAPPSGKRLAKEISKWLDSLDPDEVVEKANESIKNLPRYHWKNDEWEIDFKAIPRKKEKRLPGKKAIGIEGNGAEYVNEWEPLKNAICKKGNRYGRLNKPLVVAVNMDTHVLDSIDEMQALFGQEEFLISSVSKGEPEMRRKPNGAWFGIKGPQYTRVNGAWIFENISPWRLKGCNNTLYLNPYSETEITNEILDFPHAKANGNEMVWCSGIDIFELLNDEALEITS